MTKNKLLNVAILICKSLKLIYIIVLITATGLFIHFQITPSSYRKFDFNDFSTEKHASFLEFEYVTKSKFSINNEKVPKDNEVYKMDKLTTGSSLFLYMGLVLDIILSILCLKEFQNIVESVKKIKHFSRKKCLFFQKNWQISIFDFNTIKLFSIEF